MAGTNSRNGEPARRKESQMGSASLLPSILERVVGAEAHLARGWFSRLRQLDFDGGVLRVQVENEAQTTHLQHECLARLVAAAQNITGRFVAFEFQVAPSPPATVPRRSAANEPTLAGFVAGPSNRFARAAVVAVTESPGDTYNPLFLHGPTATGKSHLLRAAAAALRNRLDGKVYAYTAESWTAELVEHFERDTLDTLRSRLRSGGAMIIDDVQELADRPNSLDDLFHAMNALLDDQRQLIFAADRAPNELVGFPDRLIGRFSAGLVASIDLPDEETRIAILKEKARSLAIEVPDSVIQWITADASRSLNDQLGALTRIDAQSRIEAMPVTVELARRAMEGA